MHSWSTNPGEAASPTLYELKVESNYSTVVIPLRFTEKAGSLPQSCPGEEKKKKKDKSRRASTISSIPGVAQECEINTYLHTYMTCVSGLQKRLPAVTLSLSDRVILPFGGHSIGYSCLSGCLGHCESVHAHILHAYTLFIWHGSCIFVMQMQKGVRGRRPIDAQGTASAQFEQNGLNAHGWSLACFSGLSVLPAPPLS